MKILKYLFFLVLIFIIGASIYVATKDGTFQVEESYNINAPAELVYHEINDYQNWPDWEPWSQEADDMIVNYGEKTEGEGATYSWNSEKMGEGSLKTLKANPFTTIEQEINFKTPFGESKSDVYWKLDNMEDSTSVTWGMKGEQSFMEKLYYLFQDESIEDMMKPMFQKGLVNLEKEVIDKMETYSINVDGLTKHGGGYYMYTTTSSKISQIQQRYPKMIEDVRNYMEQNNIEISGNPFVIYNNYNEERGTAIYSAGFFTPSEVITPADSPVLTGFLENQRVVKTTLKGDYKNISEAWEKTDAYIAENNLEMTPEAQAFEVYAVGPKAEANPAKWLTSIYIPVQEKMTVNETETN